MNDAEKIQKDSIVRKKIEKNLRKILKLEFFPHFFKTDCGNWHL